MPAIPLPSLTASELTPNLVLIDVREQHEWDAGHAPGAIHIPLGEVPARVGELPPGADAVIVCHLGGRSASATEFLLQNGYECRNLTGGMVAYAAAGHPVVSETGAPPTVD